MPNAEAGRSLGTPALTALNRADSANHGSRPPVVFEFVWKVSVKHFEASDSGRRHHTSAAYLPFINTFCYFGLSIIACIILTISGKIK